MTIWFRGMIYGGVYLPIAVLGRKREALLLGLKATNPQRMNIEKDAKTAGAWKERKITLSWLKKTGYFDSLMRILWDDSK